MLWLNIFNFEVNGTVLARGKWRMWVRSIRHWSYVHRSSSTGYHCSWAETRIQSTGISVSNHKNYFSLLPIELSGGKVYVKEESLENKTCPLPNTSIQYQVVLNGNENFQSLLLDLLNKLNKQGTNCIILSKAVLKRWRELIKISSEHSSSDYFLLK